MDVDVQVKRMLMIVDFSSVSVPIELLISPPSYELENDAKFSGTVASTADDKGNCVTSKGNMHEVLSFQYTVAHTMTEY